MSGIVRRLTNSKARLLARRTVQVEARNSVLRERAPIYGVMVLMALAYCAGYLVALTNAP